MDNGASSYRRFLDGEDAGLVELVRDYKDGLIFYLNGFVNNLHTAEELAEDTFVKLGIRKPRYNGKASFRTWLYAIARNVAIDHIRKSRRMGEILIDACGEISGEEAQLERMYLIEERRLVLHKAMRRLSPAYQQVLWLIYFEEFSQKETAKIMGKSVHSVETLAWRARQALKKELEREGFVYEDLC